MNEQMMYQGYPQNNGYPQQQPQQGYQNAPTNKKKMSGLQIGALVLFGLSILAGVFMIFNIIMPGFSQIDEATKYIDNYRSYSSLSSSIDAATAQVEGYKVTYTAMLIAAIIQILLSIFGAIRTLMLGKDGKHEDKVLFSVLYFFGNIIAGILLIIDKNKNKDRPDFEQQQFNQPQQFQPSQQPQQTNQQASYPQQDFNQEQTFSQPQQGIDFASYANQNIQPQFNQPTQQQLFNNELYSQPPLQPNPEQSYGQTQMDTQPQQFNNADLQINGMGNNKPTTSGVAYIPQKEENTKPVNQHNIKINL